MKCYIHVKSFIIKTSKQIAQLNSINIYVQSKDQGYHIKMNYFTTFC